MCFFNVGFIGYLVLRYLYRFLWFVLQVQEEAADSQSSWQEVAASQDIVEGEPDSEKKEEGEPDSEKKEEGEPDSEKKEELASGSQDWANYSQEHVQAEQALKIMRKMSQHLASIEKTNYFVENRFINK